MAGCHRKTPGSPIRKANGHGGDVTDARLLEAGLVGGLT